MKALDRGGRGGIICAWAPVCARMKMLSLWNQVILAVPFKYINTYFEIRCFPPGDAQAIFRRPPITQPSAIQELLRSKIWNLSLNHMKTCPLQLLKKSGWKDDFSGKNYTSMVHSWLGFLCNRCVTRCVIDVYIDIWTETDHFPVFFTYCYMHLARSKKDLLIRYKILEKLYICQCLSKCAKINDFLSNIN